ncbi:MAG: 6-phosphogluconolactonase [Enhydrobacter sp.]|nr:6-phosphogluconolactonase [Enhydrobacter sp.]
MIQPLLEVLADADALARRAADLMVAAAVAKDGPFAVALSGGSTPKRLYQLLSAMSFPWARTHWFWGDERFVSADDPASNYRMTREALLSHVPVPADQIHPVPTTGLNPEEAAAQYEATLKAFHGAQHLAPDRPLFDVVLLGLGTDGHTASLFPGKPMLDERRRWVGATDDPHGAPRITLTYPALESSRETIFLVAGLDKRDRLREVLAADGRLPAARLQPQGTLRFLADRAAAGD